MGWKASLIIIENKEGLIDENAILQAIGKTNYEFEEETTLEECINPMDESFNIGLYNGNIIICDDHQITSWALEGLDELNLSREEKGLAELFPDSEIINVACHSAVNYHGYSVIKNGKKERLKVITAERPKIEFGKRINEEDEIYLNSFQKEGQNFWKEGEDVYGEDELMEDFTFGIAKRRLGVRIDQSDGDELMLKVQFKKYLLVNSNTETAKPIKKERKFKWIKYGILFLALIIWQILKRTVFN